MDFERQQLADTSHPTQQKRGHRSALFDRSISPSIRLLPQERRDLDLIHAVAGQRIHLGSACVRLVRHTLGVLSPS